jgi:hypothetical protein
MPDDVGGSVSGQEAYFAYVEKELQSLPKRLLRQFEDPSSKQESQPAGSGLAMKLGALLILTFIATALVMMCLNVRHTPKPESEVPQSLATFDWTDQTQMPQSVIGALEAAIPDLLEKDVALLYGSRLRGGPVSADVAVPRDQMVIVVARFQDAQQTSYQMAGKLGKFTDTCLIKAGGTLTILGSEIGRKLVTYHKPIANAVSGQGECTGNELFFERFA